MTTEVSLSPPQGEMGATQTEEKKRAGGGLDGVEDEGLGAITVDAMDGSKEPVAASRTLTVPSIQCIKIWGRVWLHNPALQLAAADLASCDAAAAAAAPSTFTLLPPVEEEEEVVARWTRPLSAPIEMIRVASQPLGSLWTETRIG